MRVRLLKKLALAIDGVDLSNYAVGDLMDLPDEKARLLLAEGWAIRERRFKGPSRVLAFRRSTDLGHYEDHDDVAQAS